MGIRKIFWLLSIVILWIACVLASYYFFQVEKGIRIQEITKRQKIQSQIVHREFDQLYDKWIKVLGKLSQDEDIINLTDHGKKDLSNFYLALQYELKGITRLDKTGTIVFSTPYYPQVEGKNIAGQKHVKQIMTDHKPGISPVFIAVQGYRAIVVQYPVFKNDVYDGTISFLLDFEKISKDILTIISSSEPNQVWLLTQEGVELYCSEPSHIGKNWQSFLPDHNLIRLLNQTIDQGKEGPIRISGKEENVKSSLNYIQPIHIANETWYMIISYPEKEITRSLANIRNKLIGILILIFFGGMIMFYLGVRVWIFYRDVQLKTLADKKLDESKARYQTVIETTNTGYAVLNQHGILIDTNLRFAEMTGHNSIFETIGKHIDHWSKDAKTRYGLSLSQLLDKGMAQNLETEFSRPDLSCIPVEINANKISSDGKELILMLCRDITDRMIDRENLIKERTLFKTLIDNLPSSVFIKDTQYRKLVANPIHVQSVLGHLKRSGLNTHIDLIGKTDFEVFPPREAHRYFEEERRVMENGEAIINQVSPGLGPNGENIWLLISKIPLKSENGKIIGMLGITTDITEQKQTEELLTIARDKAEQGDRLKTAFLNNISHEIRTPLNAIIGFSELIKDKKLTEEKRNHFLDIIAQSSKQLMLIITDIINVATIEAGQIRLNYGVIDINNTLRILLEQYHNLSSLKNIELLADIPLKDQDAMIMGDPTKFLEVISNLINNAIKFTEQGYVRIGYERKGDILEFYVKDTGIGIKSEFHHQIFTRFYKVPHDASSKYRGTGLGLAISQTYVELMGGKIWLHSLPDHGSTFYFTLPYQQENQELEI